MRGSVMLRVANSKSSSCSGMSRFKPPSDISAASSGFEVL